MKAKVLLIVVSQLIIFSTANAQSRFSEPFQSGSTATLELDANRSYNCYVNESGTYKLSRTVMGPDSQSINAVYPQANADVLEEVFEAAAGKDTTLDNNLISFVTPSGLANYGSYTFTMEQTDGHSFNPRLFCIDTTLICSFNTFINDFNFLEVTNTGLVPATVSYRATDFNGVETTAVGGIAPGKRADFDVHTNVGPQKFGTIVVHPLIAAIAQQRIRARLSQYTGSDLSFTEICTSLPSVFEADLELD